MKSNIMDLAQRIIDLDFYNAMDYEETPETIADKISNELYLFFWIWWKSIKYNDIVDYIGGVQE